MDRIDSASNSVCGLQMLSQDLLQASLQIPFSVPPYMSLLARAVATLEGIALTGDPDYQMVSQVSHLSVSLPLRTFNQHHVVKVTMIEFPLLPWREQASEVAVADSAYPSSLFQMQAYPFVVRKVLRDSSSGGARLLLRDMLIDADGSVKPTRMSAVLNAALGYVADHAEGFVDFDAVPAEGASLQVCNELPFLWWDYNTLAI